MEAEVLMKNVAAVYALSECSRTSVPDTLKVALGTLKIGIDDWEAVDWYKWILAGGSFPHEFTKNVRPCDNRTRCRQLWPANFAAYRCLTCGTSPYSSLCADCFLRGNHMGHAFSVFRSHAGGTCHCGDSNLIKEAEFCCLHGPYASKLCVTNAMMSGLVLRLFRHMRIHSNSLNGFLGAVQEAEKFIRMLHDMSIMGMSMRQVMTLALSNPQISKCLTDLNEMGNTLSPGPDYFGFIYQAMGILSLQKNLVRRCFLEEFVVWTARFEFPQRILCLLNLLPDTEYKEALTQAFVLHYRRISQLLLESVLDPNMLSNRVNITPNFEPSVPIARLPDGTSSLNGSWVASSPAASETSPIVESASIVEGNNPKEQEPVVIVCKKQRRKPAPIPEHISILSGNPLRYQCNVCKKKFKTKVHIKYHDYCQTSEKPFKCEECGQGFIVKSHYEYHLRTHSGERPYACPKCGKRFNQQGRVTRHMRTHTGEKPVACKLCGKRFGCAQAMKFHLSIHTGERPFACKFCDKRFTVIANLKKHHMTHTGERPFSCTTCGKDFNQKWTLTLHLRSHSGERPYACDQCSRPFSNKKDLGRHMVIHKGDRPFKCWVCGQAYKRKDNLNRHIRTTHKEPKEVSGSLATAAAEHYLASTKASPTSKVGRSRKGPKSKYVHSGSKVGSVTQLKRPNLSKTRHIKEAAASSPSTTSAASLN